MTLASPPASLTGMESYEAFKARRKREEEEAAYALADSLRAERARNEARAFLGSVGYGL